MFTTVKILTAAFVLYLMQVTNPLCAATNKQWKFDLGNGKVHKEFVAVTSETAYSDSLGYGLICPEGKLYSTEAGKGDARTSDCITSDQAFYFRINLDEGRYKIKLTLGSSAHESATTVKAESRRLMLENVETEKGQTIEKTIVVDVRRPEINDTLRVRLKEREIGSKNWDNNLCLEFNGSRPSVSSIVIEEANDLPVIFLAGNSTVTDQRNEPWASWGQMLPRFLSPEVVVANHAESGLTLISFKYQNRLKRIISVMKPGDYLFVEFAHNDQKPGSCHVEPFTTYQDELRYFINEARKKGGIPVLVTSTNRRKFDESGKLVNTLGYYPEAMRQLAKEENVKLIDLNAMTKTLYEAYGEEDSKNLFVHYSANTFPDQEKALADNTHFSTFGAYELAKCVAASIKDNHPGLAQYLYLDFKGFDPGKPDAFKDFFWPLSPSVDLVKPDGN
ncbi:rhamnogalacturonan acetylesterase [Mangrovibacterium marinum]|uniref:Lysophospholipase L1-like esterase n=1 Tax=Mangrovibacterium marinum TaxID=1639118 RepID=A0A2T5BXT2_9BACT|nr:rhamnogalacturonan acetylesterase [Mangrovibacterium marinum]PTN05917.1 lysophospholipase L1-like esterase [Mangrovibacterium marinum]